MRRLLSAIIVVVALGVIGCAKEDRTPTTIEIMPTIRTRVSGLHFETGDCIGLSVVEGSKTYAENRMMTYNGSAFTASGLLWYNDLNAKSTLTAYYPYSASGAPTSFSVATDQTGGCASSDLLAAVKKEVTPVAAPVAMVFNHLLSQLSIVVTNNSDAPVTGVVIGGLVPTATVDFEALTVQPASGGAVDVKTCEITANANYRAILVPQQASLIVTILTADGKSRSKTITDAKLESGLRYDLAVLVTNIDILLSLSGDINDWGDGGSLGDSGNSGGGGTGGDGSLIYENETYRTELLGGKTWMVENLRVKPAGVELGNGVYYPEAGAEAVAQLGMLYSYSTAMAGATYTPGATTQGICPPGWHIPDLVELTALSKVENLVRYLVATGLWWSGSTEYRNNWAGYLMGASSAEAERFDILSYDPKSSDPSSVISLKSVSAIWCIPLRCVKS